MRYVVIASFGIFILIATALPAEGGAKQLPDDARAILDNASELELYSLDPNSRDPSTDLNETDKADKTKVHGWKVLGKTTVKNAETRQKLVAAVKQDVASAGKFAECFSPRHAIRAQHEGKTVDLVICFKCRWMYVYIDGKAVADLVIATSSGPLLNKVLLDADVPR